MRISTSSYFSATLLSLRTQQNAMSRLNQQIGTGQKMLSPKDDPVASTRAMSLRDGLTMRTQFAANHTRLDVIQKEESAVLEEMHTALAKVRQGVADGRNVADQGLRNQAAATLAGLYKHIKDLANARDAGGNYLFSGFETGTVPYAHTPVYDATSSGPATSLASSYAGDEGTRRIEIDQGRYLQSSDSLSAVMQVGVAGSDVLQVLDQAAVDLRDTSIAPAALQASLDTAYNALTAAMENLESIQGALAGRQIELADARKSNGQLLTIGEDALGDLTQADQAAAIVELQQRQVALQAAESAFARTASLSLFNYLG
jgi:flagellar hook-associated protein 3 FlgL